MLRKGWILYSTLGIFLYGNAQFKSYRIDSEKSKLSFSVTHMGFLKVVGSFSDFSGILAMDATGELVAIESKIAVKSMDTADKTRDRSLMDKEYLNAKSFPYMYFKSSKLISEQDTKLIIGTLQIRDIKKEIHMLYSYAATYEKGGPIHISTVLNRTDFNIHFGALDALVGEEIRIELEIFKN
ncbi:YceI family protein [Spongiimicrobium salis]|uniref:YceI family protein n=1 Tax=Spongiimicrobium salis TaxID=1667022 RepID=UPI00374DD276